MNLLYKLMRKCQLENITNADFMRLVFDHHIRRYFIKTFSVLFKEKEIQL